jgi:hypothetical protein
MRTKILSLLLLICTTVTSSAQDNLDKIIHVWGNDFWGMSPITIDHSGNIYLSGVFSDTVFFGSKDNWLVNMDSSDFFITKIYPDGTTAWRKVITGIGSETLEEIEVGNDGYIYIIGQFDQEMIIDTAYYDTYGLFESIWTGDHFICKLDPDGNLVNMRRGSKNGENLIFRSIEVDQNGEICLIGQTKGNQVFDFQIEPIEEHWHHFMVKLNSSFDAEWIISLCDSANIENSGVCIYNAVVSDQFNNIYVAGWVDGSPNNSIYIGKIDQDGSLLWIETIAASQETGIRDVYVDKNDDVYLLNSISANTVIHFPDAVTGRAFVAKYNNEGAYLWSVGLESPLETNVVNRDGYTVAILSNYWPILDGLIIIDPDGDIVYDNTFDNIEIQSLAIDEAGNVYYNGYFQEEITIGGQVVSPLKSENYLFGRLNITEMIRGSNTEHLKQYDTYHLYPNPANDLVTVEINNNEQHTIEITSLNGQLIYSCIIEGPSYQIDLSRFHKGVYLISIKSKDYVRTERLIIQ